MDGHDLDEILAFFPDRGLLLVALGGVQVAEPSDEAAECQPFGRAKGARSRHHFQEIRHPLLAPPTQGEEFQRARLFQHLVDEHRHGHGIPFRVEAPQGGHRRAQRASIRMVLEIVQFAELTLRLDQLVVGDAEERPAERGHQGHSVVGTLDGAKQGSQALDLVGHEEALAPDDPHRDAPRDHRIAVYLGIVEPWQENRHVAVAGRARPPVARVEHFPPLLFHYPTDHARQRRSLEAAHDRLLAGFRADLFGGIQEHDRRMRRFLLPVWRQGHVVRLVVAIGGPDDDPGEDGVDRVRDLLDRAETLGEGQGRALAGDRFLGPLVNLDVGPAEAIDRLLRVAHDEEFPGLQFHLVPLRRVATPPLGQEEDDLGLERVRVLELVDQDVGEPLLEMLPRRGVVEQQVAGHEQQIVEVQDAFLGLLPLVGLDEPAQGITRLGHHLLAQLLAEPLEFVLEFFEESARGRIRVRIAPSRSTRQSSQAGQVCHAGLRHGAVRPPGRAQRHVSLTELGQESSGLLALRFDEAQEFLDLGKHLVHEGAGVGLRAIEPRSAVEQVAQAEHLPGRGSQGMALPVERDAQPQCAEQRRVRSGQFALQPLFPRSLPQERGGKFVGHLELRVHAGFHRALAQQTGAKAVDRADLGVAQVFEGLHQPPALVLVFALAGQALEFRADTHLQLASRLLRESHRGDPAQGGPSAADEVDEAGDQDAGLAGPGGRLDRQSGLQVFGRAGPVVLVGKFRGAHSTSFIAV